MDPITKDNDPSHIWTKEEIIECGVCLEEEPDFERDEVNDIISVGAQDEYDLDPDVLVDDTNDFDEEDCLPLINKEKISLMFSSIIKEKSIDESDNNNCSFLTIKQGVFGSKSSPFETLVPGKSGLINDFTNSGISFFCSGCNVFG